jgi:hypothetical protein
MLLVWTGVGLALALGGFVVAWSIRLRLRAPHYRHLAANRKELCQGRDPVIQAVVDSEELAECFANERIVRVENFLNQASFQRLHDEGRSNIERGIRNYVPTHKKGRSLPYEAMHRDAPNGLAFYHSAVIQEWVTRVVGAKVFPAGDHDQSSCSLLIYDQAGDHIGWHFDHNFYKGRQFTVLLSLVNRSADGGLSASQYMRKLPDGGAAEVDTSENSLLVFEGVKVRHKATPTNPGDLRIMLSMTYNTIPKIHWFREIVRRFKDTAFHGWKALWD